jgi:hypothetical protein
MTYHDFIVVLAHHALADPNKTLEKDIEFEQVREQILRDRKLLRQS